MDNEHYNILTLIFQHIDIVNHYEPFRRCLAQLSMLTNIPMYMCKNL